MGFVISIIFVLLGLSLIAWIKYSNKDLVDFEDNDNDGYGEGNGGGDGGGDRGGDGGGGDGGGD